MTGPTVTRAAYVVAMVFLLATSLLVAPGFAAVRAQIRLIYNEAPEELASPESVTIVVRGMMKSRSGAT